MTFITWPALTVGAVSPYVFANQLLQRHAARREQGRRANVQREGIPIGHQETFLAHSATAGLCISPGNAQLTGDATGIWY
jgi:hypothetical protein